MFYLCLYGLPHPSGGGHEGGSEVADSGGEASLWAEVSLSHGAEDLIDGGVGGQCAVKDGELPLQALRDVIPTATGVDHGCHQLLNVIALFIQSFRVEDLASSSSNIVYDS